MAKTQKNWQEVADHYETLIQVIKDKDHKVLMKLVLKDIIKPKLK